MSRLTTEKTFPSKLTIGFTGTAIGVAVGVTSGVTAARSTAGIDDDTAEAEVTSVGEFGAASGRTDAVWAASLLGEPPRDAADSTEAGTRVAALPDRTPSPAAGVERSLPCPPQGAPCVTFTLAGAVGVDAVGFGADGSVVDGVMGVVEVSVGAEVVNAVAVAGVLAAVAVAVFGVVEVPVGVVLRVMEGRFPPLADSVLDGESCTPAAAPDPEGGCVDALAAALADGAVRVPDAVDEAEESPAPEGVSSA